MKKEYYLFSAKWTSKADKWLMFWGHDSNGYRWFKPDIGIYSEEKAKELEDGYGIIKVSKSIVDNHWIVDTYQSEPVHKPVLVVPNTKLVRASLGISKKLMRPKIYKSI